MEVVLVVVIIVLAAAVTAALVAVLISFHSRGKKNNEIHYLGGADVDSGRLSRDNNFFKGVAGSDMETVVIGRQPTDRGVKVTIKNKTEGTVQVKFISGSAIIGREGDIFVNDRYVSRRHCQLIEDNGFLYLQNLSESNRTFLNGMIVETIVPLNKGDIIRIGKTELEV